MGYLIGIDLGTSSVKTVLMNEQGKIAGSAQTAYDILIPEKGHAEQHPETWWQATIDACQAMLADVSVSPEDIKGIGFSGQMHGLVVLDKNHQVIRPAIIWSDQRTKQEVAAIYQTIGKQAIGALTGNPMSTGFQTPSLLWMKKHEPAVYQRIAHVLLPKDYIRFKMTGEIGTEVTDASATAAFDVKKRSWSAELITKLGLNAEVYPAAGLPTDIAGQITAQAAKQTGLPQGTPVVYGGGDQFMQAIGNGIVKPGQVSLTIGTGGQVFSVMPDPTYDPDLRTHTFCNAVPGTWNIQGASLAAGLSLSWLNNNMLGGLSYGEINRLAQTVKPGSEGLLFLPYLTGERTPHMDAEARGTFLGLVLKHDKAHLIRAVMEGIGFALRDSVEIFEGLHIHMNQFIASGGGARSEIWLQMLADILNKEIYKVNQAEQAGVGAAITAGVGVKLYPSIPEACDHLVQLSDRPAVPIPQNVFIYQELYPIYQDAYRQNKQLFHRLTKF